MHTEQAALAVLRDHLGLPEDVAASVVRQATETGIAEVPSGNRVLFKAGTRGDSIYVLSHPNWDTSGITMAIESARLTLMAACPFAARVIEEVEEWTVFFEGLPLAADGPTREHALNEMVEALREYAADWYDHLHTASNHVGNLGLVRLIQVSTDDQLIAWMTGAGKELVN